MLPSLSAAAVERKRKKLLEQVRDVMRFKHYGLRTERRLALSTVLSPSVSRLSTFMLTAVSGSTWAVLLVTPLKVTVIFYTSFTLVRLTVMVLPEKLRLPEIRPAPVVRTAEPLTSRKTGGKERETLWEWFQWLAERIIEHEKKTTPGPRRSPIAPGVATMHPHKSCISLCRGHDCGVMFLMNRLVFAACLFVTSVFLLTSCATDDDPFPVHSAANARADAPVAGADTPPRDSSSAGWKW